MELVVSGAAPDRVVTVAAVDQVVAGAGRVGERRDGARAVGGEVDSAVVADEDVVAVVPLDRVGAAAAEDHIVVGTAVEMIGARVGRVRRHDEEDPIRGVTGDLSVVADDRVVAVDDRAVTVDPVVPGAAEQDVVAGVAVDGVVAADPWVGGDHVVAHRVEIHDAVVAENDVITGARVDGVVRGAAEDDVVAGATVDRVVAADCRIGRRDRNDGAGQVDGVEPVDAAVVAENHVVTDAARDHVAEGAAENDVVAGAADDRVDAADRGLGRKDVVAACQAALLDDAVVSKNDVGAAGRRDRVAAGAAQDDVVAAECGDLVGGARRAALIAGVDEVHVGEAVALHGAVVAEDDRRPGAQRDHVGADAAEDDVVARAGRSDRVGCAKGRILGRDVVRDRLVHVHDAVVAEDDVVARAVGGDRVGADAAENHVRAAVRQDRVAAAGCRRRIGRLDLEDVGERPEADVPAAADDAVVAEHDSGAGVQGDLVGAEASEDDVVRAGDDRVCVAERARAGDEGGHVVLERLVHVHLAVVTQDDVLAAGVRRDRVGADPAQDHVRAAVRDDRVARAGRGGRVRRLDVIDVGQ